MLLSAPCFAADGPPGSKPTIEDLQKQVTDLQTQIDTLKLTLQGAQEQRDMAAKALADVQLQQAVAVAEANKKAQGAPPPSKAK